MPQYDTATGRPAECVRLQGAGHSRDRAALLADGVMVVSTVASREQHRASPLSDPSDRPRLEHGRYGAVDRRDSDGGVVPGDRRMELLGGERPALLEHPRPDDRPLLTQPGTAEE